MLVHIDAGAYASTFITEELTRLMDRMFGIDVREAAEDTGAQLIVLRRPAEQGETAEQILTRCKEVLAWSH